MANSPVVIDANLAIFSVLNTPQSTVAMKVLQHFAEQGCELFVPGLWWYEVTSVLHRYRFLELITDEIAHQALQILTLELGVQKVDVQPRLAFDWATRLRQKSAYDGFYLAAAERLGAEFWTADQALVNNARQVGAGWAHWMGELSS